MFIYLSRFLGTNCQFLRFLSCVFWYPDNLGKIKFELWCGNSLGILQCNCVHKTIKGTHSLKIDKWISGEFAWLCFACQRPMEHASMPQWAARTTSEQDATRWTCFIFCKQVTRPSFRVGISSVTNNWKCHLLTKIISVTKEKTLPYFIEYGES